MNNWDLVVKISKFFHRNICMKIFLLLFSLRSSGFKPLPFDANEDHYGCPVPASPLTGKVSPCFKCLSAFKKNWKYSQIDPTSWWTEQWYRSKYEAEVFRSLALENRHFNSSTFFSKVLKHMEKSKLWTRYDNNDNQKYYGPSFSQI